MVKLANQKEEIISIIEKNKNKDEYIITLDYNYEGKEYYLYVKKSKVEINITCKIAVDELLYIFAYPKDSQEFNVENLKHIKTKKI